MIGRTGSTGLSGGTFARAAAILALTLVVVSSDVRAHQDPPACTGIDTSMRLVVTRNDGSPVVGAVSECETLRYQAELEWDDECLIQSGTFRLVTPDGVEHVIANPVPCLGDATVNAEGCTIGQALGIISPIIPYQASPGDIVDGNLTATAVWQNGVLHQAPGNVPGQSDMRAIVVTAALCDDGAFCNGAEVCDPQATDGIALGICQPGTPPDCGSDDACTDRLCNEDTDTCDEIDTSDRCGESDFCVQRGCDPETGCFENDMSETQCPDEFCTERICNPATGQCDETDMSDRCGDGDECSDLVCNEATDTCDPVDTSGRCGASDQCTERGCDPQTGCFENDVSDRCDDGDLCTEDACDPEQGCIVVDRVVCNGDDPCIPVVCNPETGLCEEQDGTDTPFLIKQTARFGNAAEIAGGLGVNLPGGRLRLGRSVFMLDGASLKGDLVSIGNGAVVNDVFTNQFLLPRDNSAIVNGDVMPVDLPLEEFFCPIPEFTCGGPSVTIPPGGSLGPLDPGTYSGLRMLNGSRLTLKPGTFTFCDVRTGRNVDIRTTGGGTTTINVDGKFRLANGSFMGPEAGSTTPVLNVAGKRVRIGAGSTLQALLSAPDALLTMGRGATLTGIFCVCRARSDKNITLQCPPFVASPSGAFLDPLD